MTIARIISVNFLSSTDGDGMDEQGILKCLMLGSPDDNYEEHSLSKFGLGLKSAAFSQGEQLEVISSQGGGQFNKFVISLEEISKLGKYMAGSAGSQTMTSNSPQSI